MITDATRTELSLKARAAAAVLWPSFFSAGVATTVCFALVDPLLLRDITFPALQITRELGYSIGFFVFWTLCASSSLFTLWLAPGGGSAPARDSDASES